MSKFALKLFIFTASLIVISTIYVVPAHATDLEVTCSVDSCAANHHSPLFDLRDVTSNLNVTKEVTIKNDSNVIRAAFVAIPALLDSQPSLAQKLNITIKKSGSDRYTYGPASLARLQELGEVELTEIPPGHLETYQINVSSGNLGNDYRSKSLNLDLTFGFLDALYSTVIPAQVFRGGTQDIATNPTTPPVIPDATIRDPGAPAQQGGQIQGASTENKPETFSYMWLLLLIPFILGLSLLWRRVSKHRILSEK